ncbi:MAG: AAA family ATPase [Parasphingorhabdus sp.]|uniref:AAA family ATPase n=1 Tax=Parasphingorhabdus sp. TaxID=2709688 RepID=UPI003298A416
MTKQFSGVDFADIEDEHIVELFKDMAGNDRPTVKANMFDWPNPTSIPPRPWILGEHILQRELTVIAAKGGTGKTALSLGIVVSLITGRACIGLPVYGGPRKTWLYNLEESMEELSRLIAATGKYHGIDESAHRENLFVNSGVDEPLITATESRDGLTIAEPVYDALKVAIQERGIEVFMVDPFVSSHQINENDNTRIDAVAKRWKRLAAETNCAVVLVHHSSKTRGGDSSVEDARGASALIDAARIGIAMNKVSAADAERHCIPAEDAKAIVRIDMGKANKSAGAGSKYMRFQSVSLGNGLVPDCIGVLEPYALPDALTDITARHVYETQQIIKLGNYRENVQADDWAGKVVAEVTGMCADADKKKVSRILKTWVSNGAFRVEKSKTEKGRTSPYVRVDREVDPNDITT